MCIVNATCCKRLIPQITTCNMICKRCVTDRPYSHNRSSTYYYIHVLHVLVPITTNMYMCRGFESHPGSSFFLGKVTALGVLCCFALFVCLTLLASFFLPSHLSFKNMYIERNIFSESAYVLV